MMGIKPAFWLANAQEACERLAYFGIRAVLPLMMVSVGTGGLGLSMGQKGAIFGVWALIQCLVPMVSGGFSENFGYKKSLIVAFTINTLGYLLMANILNVAALINGNADLDTTLNFWLMMLGGITIGLGTAIFKPPVQGIVAKSLNKKNSGFGFGLFYWVVNIGGVLAPMVASALRGNEAAPTWHYVFYGAAFVTIFNLIITLIFFKEPKHTKSQKAKKSPIVVFVDTLKILWNDRSILLFLLIVSGFWLMFMQLWDLLPNFIEEWVDRRTVGEWLAQFSIFDFMLEADKSLKPEMIINIDAAIIVLLVLPLSAFFARFKMITSLVLGMFIASVGFIMSGLTMSGGLCCLAVLIFAIGEIICSPKFNEYIGMTAPADKKAIYMGFSNMPFAIGWAFGNFLSGPLYDVLSSKKLIGVQWAKQHGITTHSYTELNLSGAREYLTNSGMDESSLPGKLDYLHNWLIARGQDPSIVKNIHVDNLTNDQMISLLTQDHCTSAADLATCQNSRILDLIQNNGLSLEPETGIIAWFKRLFNIVSDPMHDNLVVLTDRFLSGQQLEATKQIIVNSANIDNNVPLQYFPTDVVLGTINSDPYAATEILWNFGHPWVIWLILGGIGVASMIGMIVFYYRSGMRNKDEGIAPVAEASSDISSGASQIMNWAKNGDLSRFVRLSEFVRMGDFAKLMAQGSNNQKLATAKFIDLLDSGEMTKFIDWASSGELQNFIAWYNKNYSEAEEENEEDLEETEETEDSKKAEEKAEEPAAAVPTSDVPRVFPDASEEFEHYMTWNVDLLAFTDLIKSGLGAYIDLEKSSETAKFAELARADIIQKFAIYASSFNSDETHGLSAIDLSKYRKDVLSDPTRGVTTDDVENITYKD